MNDFTVIDSGKPTGPTYEERVAGKYYFSFSFTVPPEESETKLKVLNSTFYCLNTDKNDAIFSMNEREDGKGMNVHIENVKVVPSNMLCIANAPSWLVKVLSKLFETV